MTAFKVPTWRPYFELDALADGLLPVSWQEDILNVVRTRSYKTLLTGAGATSREKNALQTISVNVADGLAIKPALPWLWDLYEGAFREFSARSFNRNLYAANDVQSAVNINTISGVNGRYEWHVDSNPVTGLLFVSTCAAADGGALVFRNARVGKNAIVRPRAGRFLCFDAREIAHRVAPLRKDVQRISIPMNYYESPTIQTRPSDLDTNLYSSTQS